jgi:hypothetical protein
VFTDIEELVGTAVEVERMLGELGETPFEPLKEEQQEEVTGMSMKNPIVALNNALINFLEGSIPDPISSFTPALFMECQVCERRDHIARTCPRLNAPWPKCARCGGPLRTESCGVRYPFYSDLGCAEGRCQRMQKESRFGAANFLEALPSDGVALATVKDRVAKRRPVDEFVEMTEVTNVVTGRKWQDAVTPCKAPRTETNDTQVNVVKDEGCTKAITATKEVISVHEEATVHMDRAPLADNETDDFCEGVGGQIAVESVGAVQDLEEADTPPTEYLNIDDEMNAGMAESANSGLPPFVVNNDPKDQGVIVLDQCLQGYADDVLQTVNRNTYGQDPCVQESGILISKHLVNVQIQILPPPRLKDHDTECFPGVGQWNMMQKKMVNGGSVRHWACINLSQYVTVAMALQLCNELIEMCRTSGMVFEMNPMLTIQCTEPGHCDGVRFLNRTRTAISENNQLSSDMEVVVLNKKVAHDNFGETSNEVCLADEHEERATLNDISDDGHSATSKGKKNVVDPEATLSTWKMDANETT